jgi:hypothetical protein
VHLAAAGRADAPCEPQAPDLWIPAVRDDIETSSLQIEHLLETAGVIGTERQGGEFAI